MSVNNLMTNIFDAKFGKINKRISENTDLINSNEKRINEHSTEFGNFRDKINSDLENRTYESAPKVEKPIKTTVMSSPSANIATAPDVVAPDVVAPDVVAPDVVAPDVVAPDVVSPDVVSPAFEKKNAGDYNKNKPLIAVKPPKVETTSQIKATVMPSTNPSIMELNISSETFANYNNTKQSSNHFQGVNVNKLSQLSGSEFQSDKKELVLDLEKDETGHMMSFLLQQNDMNKQVGKKELEEALEKDTEKVAEAEAEGFSNYKSVELDSVSTFYVGSLSVIMLYYIYRSLRK